MTQTLLESLRANDLAAEMGQAQFGDPRLSTRCSKIVQTLSRSPATSLPQLAADDAELAATYRFFNNDRVTAESILAPHTQATAHRIGLAKDVLVIHDTTETTYAGEQRAGLGDVSAGEGFLAHPSLAVARQDGVALPLGLLSLQFLTRDPDRTRRKRSQKAMPLFSLQNEYRRWPLGVQQAARLLERPTEVIHVMDREGDNYAFLDWLVGHSHRFVIRLAHDRTLAKTVGQQVAKSVSEALSEVAGVCQRTVHIGKRVKKGLPDADRKHPPRNERDAVLSFAATSLSLARPHGREKTLSQTIAVNVVRVWEQNPPPGEKPIQWLLATREPVDTPEQIQAVVDIYCHRWIIEEYIKALKTGCAVQERGFLTAHALLNIFALTVPIAWQLLCVRALSRLPQPVSASIVLSPSQLSVLHAATRELPPKQRPPPEPTCRQALLAIAALGGHLTRNGEPGWITIARGFEKLRLMHEGHRLMTLYGIPGPNRV